VTAARTRQPRQSKQFTALVLKYGPVPPAREPERTQFLTQAGRREAGLARVAALEVTCEITHHLPTSHFPFAMHFSQDRDILWGRFKHWHILACDLRSATQQRFDRALPGEAAARRALTHATAAYRYLRGGLLEQAADLQLHRIGELVGGIYGCWYEFKTTDGSTPAWSGWRTHIWGYRRASPPNACAQCAEKTSLNASIAQIGFIRWKPKTASNATSAARPSATTLLGGRISSGQPSDSTQPLSGKLALHRNLAIQVF
jgi:hypothetical protein